jgi:hypothetical protein
MTVLRAELPTPYVDAVGAPNAPVFFVTDSRPFFNIHDTKAVLRGGRAVLITDMDSEHPQHELRNCLFTVRQGFPWPSGPNAGKIAVADWVIRNYRLTDFTLDTVRCVDTTRVGEPTKLKDGHAWYFSACRGVIRAEKFSAKNIPANMIQHRLSGNRADPDWANFKSFEFIDVHGEEIGQARGAGRAAFALSFKDMGPNAMLELVRPFVRTVKQSRVEKRSDGTWADSFGGILVEYCKAFTLYGDGVGAVILKNPGRPALQCFDYANKAKTKTGPEEITVYNYHFEAGDVVIRLEDSLRSAKVLGCSGPGNIKLYRHNGTSWRLDHTTPIKGGFVYKA